MSVVTTVMLTVHSSDLGNVTRLNEIVHQRFNPRHMDYYRLESLTECTEIWGGSKVPQAEVFGGAFNHLDLDMYLDCFQEVAWGYPEEIRLLVKGEHDDGFAVYVWSQPKLTRLDQSGGCPGQDRCTGYNCPVKSHQ